MESGRAPRGYIMLSGIIGESCHKYHFCRHKHMFVAKYVFCRDKTRLLSTKLCLYTCLSRQIFVATNIILSRQNFCRYKHTFVATNTCLSWHSKIMFLATYNCDKYLSQKAQFCRNNFFFVTTSILLWRQTRVCRDKNMLVATKLLYCTKRFVTTSILLTRQKTCFVATKMILVAARASDTPVWIQFSVIRLSASRLH